MFSLCRLPSYHCPLFFLQRSALLFCLNKYMPDSENRRIVVNLNQPAGTSSTPQMSASPFLGQTAAVQTKRRRGGCGKILLAFGGLLLILAVVGAIAGYWYYTNLLKSPAYSLALLVDAVRKDDKPKTDELLDTDAVVDSFMPQVTDKAKERYGRGFPPETVRRAEQMFQPLVPEIKNAARRELPRVLKERLKNVPEVSPWATAFAINRAAEIKESGDAATVVVNYQNAPTELTMQRAGDRWRVVGFKNEALADRIANEVAQRIVAELNKKPGARGGNTVDRKTIEELRRQIEQIVP
jgi:hypothetical protein